MELIQQVGINVEQVQRRRIGQTHDLHVAEQQEEIVQLVGLHPELALVAAIGHSMQEVVDVVAPGHERIVSQPDQAHQPDQTELAAHMFNQYDSLTRKTLLDGASKTPVKSRPNRKSPEVSSPSR